MPPTNQGPGACNGQHRYRALRFTVFKMDGKDTYYRVHGTNQPNRIGKAVSAGCIRMHEQ